MNVFQLAGASVTGTMHFNEQKIGANQDAFAVEHVADTVFGNVSICLVLDGCGSGDHSDVGAKLGARLLATAIRKQLVRWQKPIPEPGKPGTPPRLQFKTILNRARQDVLAIIRTLTYQMGGSYSQTCNDYFLFTVVGAIITDDFSCFFSRGDGLIVINGAQHWIEPGEGNAPVYMNYGNVETSIANHAPTDLEFDILRVMNTEGLDSFLIGSDGLEHFVKAEGLPLPGKRKLVGPLSLFWESDKIFRNSDEARRVLALANQCGKKPDWEGRRLVNYTGHLKDDTTLIVGRRTP